MEIFELSKGFPREEQYALTDQIRRASRNVCANITEAWRKRRYRGAFVLRLSDADGEVAETTTWIEFSKSFGYIDGRTAADLTKRYDHILGILVNMMTKPSRWILEPLH
ncbi:MAG: four helix bundle protein [Gemmatimonadetes bacterium]|nr:four helix bundle protein [Gemmatimonadota bacterium]